MTRGNLQRIERRDQGVASAAHELASIETRSLSNWAIPPAKNLRANFLSPAKRPANDFGFARTPGKV
jgi:hypothetical protein